MTFYDHLITELLINAHNNYGPENHDAHRFGPYPLPVSAKTSLVKKGINKVLRSFNYYNKELLERHYASSFSAVQGLLANYTGKLHYFEYLYNLLENKESKDVLVKVLAYRIMGPKKVMLPVNNAAYWKNLKMVDQLIEGNDEIDINFLGLKLKKFNLQKLGYPVSLYFNSLGLLIDYVLEQYKYSSADKTKAIEVEKGDVVIDGGACFGDTALYFAEKAGPTGKVYSFEFIPDNIKILQKNCALNPAHEKNIELVPYPLWNSSGIPVYYKYNGPGSKVSFEKIPDGTGETKTKSIDDLVREKNIPKVHFIKMDIEGAELQALHGSIETIKKHKPKLAITVYHSPEDFGTIPKFIHDLNLGYKFYLGHYTIYQEETVLFAEAK